MHTYSYILILITKRTRLDSTDLSIIIVNYNAKRFLTDCLLSLYNTVRHITYEIIIIDNNSSDGSVNSIRKRFPKVKLIINKDNLGYARANNQGVKIARGNLILLLNPDTIVSDESIQKMVTYARTHTDVGIIGCRVINPGDKLQWDSCGSFLTPLTLFLKESGLEKISPNNYLFGLRLMWYWHRNSSRVIDWVSGVCMLIKKEVIRDAGMLDERYFAYMEDMDYCRNALRTRWQTFFLHSAEIFHNISASWTQRSEKHLFTSLTSEKKYFEKYYGNIGAVFFKLLYIFGSYIRMFINVLAKDRKKARDHYRILNWLLKNES
jgi:GT2 family glycosyltransferase